MASKTIPETLVKTWSITKEKSPPVSKEAGRQQKRSKACFHCRTSKVKCDNNNGDYSNPCKRCTKQNLECYYEYKVSNYKSVNEDGSKTAKVSALMPGSLAKASLATDGTISSVLKTLHSNLPHTVSAITKENLAALVEKSIVSKRKHHDIDKVRSKKRKFIAMKLLNEIITLPECLTLFAYFEEFVSSQLFGFTLLKSVNVKTLYEKNSILAVTICYLSSIHHLALSSYSEELKELLDSLTFKVIFQNDHPSDDFEAFHTILSLCLASFWLNQNYTGVAVQLAKNSGINLNRQSAVPSEDKIKLWYLLYTLDGQQALAYHREPLITSKDLSIHKIKKKLLEDQPSTLFHDIRLVSQVEYNAITNEVFQGMSWDVLDPSRFGIPYKTNLELDQWMVHWTVLLSSLNGFDKNVWSSKSTLMYYNFAKMHVNSNFIRGLIGGNSVFAEWNAADFAASENESRFEELDDDEDEDEDEDEDDFAPGANERDPIISSKIATTSAMNILQLVLFDDDVMNSLKYCPTHIHILLYYAVLLTLNSPVLAANGYSEFLKLVKLLKNLLKVLSLNLPIDKAFGLKLIYHLKKSMIQRIESILSEENLDATLFKNLQDELNRLQNNSHIEEDYDSEKKAEADKKISAWPGTDHSHPIVSNTEIIDFSS